MTSVNTEQEIQGLEAILAILQAENKGEGGDNPLLVAIIQTVTQTLASLQGHQSVPVPVTYTESATHFHSSSNPTNSQMSTAMAELAEALAELQVLIGKYGQDKQNMNNKDMQSMIKEAQAQIAQAQKDLENIEKQQNQHSFWDIFLKVVTAIVGAIFTVISCATGQFELAFVIVALTVAAETGAFDKATKFISNALQSMGVPAKDANIIASVLVIVSVVVITVLSCGAAAPDAAAVVADTAIDAGETAAEAAEETAETISEEFQSFGQTLKNVGNSIKNAASKILEYNPFNKLSKATSLGILTGAQAVMATNFAQNLVLAIPGLSSKERERLEKALEIITDIICTILSAGAGAGAAAGGAAAAAETSLSASTLRTLNLGALGMQGLSAAGNIRLATIDAQIADLEATLGSDNASLALFQNLMKLVDSNSQNGNTATTKTEAAHSEELTTLLSDLPKAGQALAQILSA